MKWLKALAAGILLLSLACLWFWRYQITEHEKVHITDVIYASEDIVPFGENFFWSNSENSNGYSITVDHAEVQPVRSFLEEHGTSWDSVYSLTKGELPPSEYVYLITATVMNSDNTDGQVRFGNFLVIDGAILLQLDSTLNSLSAPELANAGSFTLPVGKSRTFTFAFTPDAASVAANDKDLYQRMQNDVSYLCISQVPERRLIQVTS